MVTSRLTGDVMSHRVSNTNEDNHRVSSVQEMQIGERTFHQRNSTREITSKTPGRYSAQSAATAY